MGVVGTRILCDRNNYIMKETRPKKQAVKFPLIKEKLNVISNTAINRSLKLEKINRQKHIALIDISKINKIEKEYAQMTRRKEDHDYEHPEHKNDELRESKLLLLKNITPQSPKKNTQLNRLSNLVEYSPPPRSTN